MEKKKLLKNKIVDTLPVLYLETVILMVLGQFLGNFVLGIPVGIAYARNPEILNSAFLNTTLMYVIFWGIWAVALFWIGIRKRNRPILQAVGTKPQGNNWKYLLFGLVLGFALNGFCILIAWLHHDIVLTYDAIHPLWFVVVFLTVFIQSSAEELLCRGFLYQKLRRSYKNPVVAIVGNALLFALLHLDLAQSITALVCGIFLGWLVERSGSILPGMLLHFINNTLAFLSLYLRQYAPEQLAVVYELILLVALPLAALFLVWRVKAQGFSFSAGLRGGMEPLAVFTSLPYTVCVLFLMGLTVYLYRVG